MNSGTGRRTVTIDPRDFITAPYSACPKCNGSQYGLLMIQGTRYTRRCKECWHTASADLPPVHKKVLYFDQFALSNMMKAISEGTRSKTRHALDPFWRELFDQVYALCRLQLVTCPSSTVHQDESLLSPFFEALREMYNLLGHGAMFMDVETIQRFEIHDHASWWINPGRTDPYRSSIKRETVLYGDINVWNDRMFVTVNRTFEPKWIDELRAMRSKGHDGVTAIFKRWSTEKAKSFDDWYAEELAGVGHVIVTEYAKYLKRHLHAVFGLDYDTVNDLFPPSYVLLMHSVLDQFKAARVPDDELLQKAIEYFRSPLHSLVPFEHISALLYAAIARKAASGRKKPPNRGTMMDVQVLSTLLPFCDVMFIDNECNAYLQEEPLRSRLGFATRTFSLNTKDEFLAYLKSLRDAASTSHLAIVEELYGHSWSKPYRKQ